MTLLGEGSQSQCLRSETAAPPHILTPRLMQQKKKVSQGYEFMFDSIPIGQVLAAQFTGLEVPMRLDVKLDGFKQRG